MIISRKWGLTIAEIWFDTPRTNKGVDVMCLIQHPCPIDSANCRERYTLLTDLTQPEEAIFKTLSRQNRQIIRQALQKQDHLTRNPRPDRATTREFHDFYRQFALSKRLPAIHLSYLEDIAGSGHLDFSQAIDRQSGEVLVWHAHLVFPGRVRLHWSASHFRHPGKSDRRNEIAKANRLLHWCDLMRFREAAVPIYDWGGWYAGDQDEQRLRINRFKQEFGGSPSREWNGEIALTWRGRLFSMIRKAFGRSEW